MKFLSLNAQYSLIIGLILLTVSAHTQTQPLPVENEFSFVFMTDIHLQPEKNAVEGFTKAIEKVNSMNPDFDITGGDLIMDALGVSFERADMLYNLYETSIKKFNMPVYNTLGNHEVFGLYKDESGVEPNHPEFCEKMFVNRLGDKNYSYNHKGWHFIILDSVEEGEDNRYFGTIDSLQMEWIKADLAAVDKNTPIVISTHIPFITTFQQILYNSTDPNGKGLVVTNSKQVLDLFDGYNLQLILQGHLHIVEHIFVMNKHFLIGGAVCGAWWKGPNYGTEEGFMVIRVKDGSFSCEYVDYGWEVEKK